jgi:hypothetical protein
MRNRYRTKGNLTKDSNILAPLEQPQQPQPSLTGLEPIVTTSAIPSEMVKIPAQPTDPKAQRNLGKNVEFQPSDASIAVDVAGKLSTPYWEVIAVENPRTKKWYLQAKDNSKSVADMQTQAANLNISVERLALDKQKEAREAQKAEIERIKEERTRLKEDKTYLKKIKNNISEQSKNIELIDDAMTHCGWIFVVIVCIIDIRLPSNKIGNDDGSVICVE